MASASAAAGVSSSASGFAPSSDAPTAKIVAPTVYEPEASDGIKTMLNLDAHTAALALSMIAARAATTDVAALALKGGWTAKFQVFTGAFECEPCDDSTFAHAGFVTSIKTYLVKNTETPSVVAKEVTETKLQAVLYAANGYIGVPGTVTMSEVQAPDFRPEGPKQYDYVTEKEETAAGGVEESKEPEVKPEPEPTREFEFVRSVPQAHPSVLMETS
jgi:hypothetical protein